MNLKEEFDQAVAELQQLTKRPSTIELLQLYALYKQGTEGDVATEKPGGFDFKAIAKYDAWAELKGKSTEQAMQEYVALVKQLKAQYA